MKAPEYELNEYDDKPKKKRKHPRFRRRIAHNNRVFHHPQREIIELKLAAGFSTCALEKEYNIPGNILRAYRQNNLTQSFKDKVKHAMTADGRLPDHYDPAFRNTKDLDTHIAEITHQKALLCDAQAQALKIGNLNLIAPLATAINKLLEQEAKLRGYLHEAAISVQNNLNQTVNEQQQPEPDLSSLSVDELEALMSLTIKIEAANNPKIKVIDHVR